MSLDKNAHAHCYRDSWVLGDLSRNYLVLLIYRTYNFWRTLLVYVFFYTPVNVEREQNCNQDNSEEGYRCSNFLSRIMPSVDARFKYQSKAHQHHQRAYYHHRIFNRLFTLPPSYRDCPGTTLISFTVHSLIFLKNFHLSRCTRE